MTVKKKVTKKKPTAKKVAQQIPVEGTVTMPGGIEVVPGEDQGLGFITGTNLPRTRKKVAIVGFAPSSMGEVKSLFDDPDFEVWGLNQLYMVFPILAKHASRWFQIHNKQSYNSAVRDHSHHDWMAKPFYVEPGDTKHIPVPHAMPIYMQEHFEDIPMSVPFPVQQIMRHFGDYFTNSISWMIAVAILEGFEQIHIYGVDMAQDDEYAEQRPSCEYFIGLARGAGITVHVPAASDLCKTMWLYPFEDNKPFRLKLDARRQELRQRMNEAANTEQGAHDARMQLVGALENMQYIQKTWMVTANEQGVTKDHLARMEGDVIE